MKGLHRRTIETISAGDKSLLGIQLGHFVVSNQTTIPVLEGQLGVSKQTLYGWFRGKSKPRSRIIILKVKEILEKLQSTSS